MKVSIRDLKVEDAAIAWQWRNDPDIWKYTDRGERPKITVETERDWITEVIQREKEKRFAICVGEAQKYVGNVQLTDINNEEAEFHIFIGEKEFWGKGIATKATNLLLNYAISKLKFKKINLKVSKENIAAIKVYERIGFVVTDEQDRWLLMSYFVPMG